jgi:hypothetical protein
MKYTLVNCSPVPAPMAPIVSHLLRVSGASLQSAYRGTDASALLARCGKHDQAYLYNGWVRRLPGFNPANPPGRSTHELRSDGIAYRGPLGRRLRWWQIGLDIDDAHVAAFIAAAAKDGWLVFRPTRAVANITTSTSRRSRASICLPSSEVRRQSACVVSSTSYIRAATSSTRSVSPDSSSLRRSRMRSRSSSGLTI